MERQEKEKLVEGIREHFAKAKAAYLTEFTGLPVMTVHQLRSKILKAGGNYQVIKNTLARLGMKGTQYEKLSAEVKGPIGWASTKGDPVLLAKALKEFRKEHEEFVYTKGVFDGQNLDVKGIDSLAEMPPKEVLLAQLLGMMNGPARSLVTVIQAVPRQLVTVIDAIRRKKEEESKNG